MTEIFKAFTLVFEGDIRTFAKNPFITETPFGVPYAVAAYDALEMLEEAEARAAGILEEGSAPPDPLEGSDRVKP